MGGDGTNETVGVESVSFKLSAVSIEHVCVGVIDILQQGHFRCLMMTVSLFGWVAWGDEANGVIEQGC